MTNITISIDDDIYKKMHKFSEIKWGEFVRKCIQRRIDGLESIKSGIYADESLLAKNWLSKEDDPAWKNL